MFAMETLTFVAFRGFRRTSHTIAHLLLEHDKTDQTATLRPVGRCFGPRLASEALENALFLKGTLRTRVGEVLLKSLQNGRGGAGWLWVLFWDDVG